MKFGRQKTMWLATVLGACPLLWISPSLGASAASLSVVSNEVVLPPEPPLFSSKSPVDVFRELLAVPVAERNQMLADRPPENRKRILAKVREYESLKPDFRELRLQATDLRWYLLPLMSMSATNRAAQLAQVPIANRKLVEDRLIQWDRLPAATQKALLKNEATIRYFTEIQGANAQQQRKLLDSLSPARLAQLQAGITQWQALPEEQRRRMTDRFYQFFDLTAPEKDRALNSLSEPERRQIEKTLRAYKGLTPEQRAQCVRSFEEFARMTVEERQQFLKNADRWKLMTPNERQAWRDLVGQVTMLPPENNTPPLPRTPVLRPKPVVATNGE